MEKIESDIQKGLESQIGKSSGIQEVLFFSLHFFLHVCCSLGYLTRLPSLLYGGKDNRIGSAWILLISPQSSDKLWQYVYWSFKPMNLADFPESSCGPSNTLKGISSLVQSLQNLTWRFLSVFKLQASETLRNSTHSSTAADLLHAKQQILSHQQQLEEQDHLLEDYQKKKEDFKMQISFLQEKIRAYEMVCLF